MNISDSTLNNRVLIVEDDTLLANELSQLIDLEPNFNVIGCAGDFATGLNLLDQPHEVFVVDVGLPDGDGIELLKRQQQLWPNAKSLVMTVFDDRDTTTRAIAAGADGYIMKTDPQFLGHLKEVVANQHPIDPTVTGYLVEALRRDVRMSEAADVQLTPREQQTLSGLSLGLSYREIAEKMHVSPHTVTDYIKGVYRKLDVNSRSEAVYAGVRRGLVNFP